MHMNKQTTALQYAVMVNGGKEKGWALCNKCMMGIDSFIDSFPKEVLNIQCQGLIHLRIASVDIKLWVTTKISFRPI